MDFCLQNRLCGPQQLREFSLFLILECQRKTETQFCMKELGTNNTQLQV